MTIRVHPIRASLRSLDDRHATGSSVRLLHGSPVLLRRCRYQCHDTMVQLRGERCLVAESAVGRVLISPSKLATGFLRGLASASLPLVLTSTVSVPGQTSLPVEDK